MGTMQDIQNRKDIEFLVDSFYTKAMADESLAPFFTGDLALNFEQHKPIMCDFWEFNLFQTPMTYMRNVMQPHIHLNEKRKIENSHFERWIAIFHQTVDELFAGSKADKAKESAFTIGMTMEYKIRKLNKEG
jgi:hemoglobin